jgi:hypothetical protein
MPKVVTRACVLAVLGAALVHTPFVAAQSDGDDHSMSTMKKMDTNKDGMVSRDEYMSFYEQKFDAMDKNKDKMVTQEEWLSIQLRASDGR